MIDINNLNIQKLKLSDLIADAVERKDTEAINWLHEKAMQKIERNGKVSFQPVNAFRVEYLTKFCGYKKRSTEKLTPEQKRERMLEAMFAEAHSKVDEA